MESWLEVHYNRIVNDVALYAQTFSEGNLAAAGKAPFGTTAKKVDGGWLLDGRKIFASLSGAATHYGILCTEEKPESSSLDTMYIAVPTNSSGFSISGEWAPLGMTGTVCRNLIMKDVVVPVREQLMPKGPYHFDDRTIPPKYFTLPDTY